MSRKRGQGLDFRRRAGRLLAVCRTRRPPRAEAMFDVGFRVVCKTEGPKETALASTNKSGSETARLLRWLPLAPRERPTEIVLLAVD